MQLDLLNSARLFAYAFGLSALLTPCVIWATRRIGLVALPREDRWHKRPTALLGGIAIFVAFALPYLALGPLPGQPMLVLAAGAAAIFILGLLDDLFELSPQGKFIGQLIIAACVVAGGLRIPVVHPIVAIVLTVFWFVAITNAMNILDNMDGLAAGIAFVAACSLWAESLLYGPTILTKPAILLAGATAGFWIYNCNPAKIFMGDCGSLFLGFLLAALTVMGTWGIHGAGSNGVGYAGVSSLILMLTVPVAVFIIPIFDTAFVSFSRVQTGRSPFKGGRDHTSHRLVLLGYSESRTVLTLMALAAITSTAVLYLLKYSAHGLLVVVSVVAVIALFFGVFLTHLNPLVYNDTGSGAPAAKRVSLLSLILNKKQILQAVVDTVLVTAAYFASYLLRYEGEINAFNASLLEKSLPLLIPIKLSCFWAFGLYRGQWRFVSIEDVWQIAKAVVAGSLLVVGILLYLYRFEGFSRVVFVNDALLTLFFIGGARLLMRLFKEYFTQQAERRHTTPILIFGAGDGGDLFLRELRKNPHHDYFPAGFIDDDPAKKGQIIHGVRVLGNRQDIPELVQRYGVKKVFISIISARDEQLQGIRAFCDHAGVLCKQIRPLIPRMETGADPGCAQGEDTAMDGAKVVHFTSKVRRKK